MSRPLFEKGDWVVYCKAKCTTHPGPRARDIHAAANGDSYFYSVEKCWLVERVLADGNLLLRTRRGKNHVIARDDPKLRIATLWDRIRYRTQFKQLQLSQSIV
jgi:hypothetical protein